MKGTWIERRQRHPVRVRGDGQDAGSRQPAADLHEVPDEVDVEAVARRQLVGHVHVVEGIGVGGIAEDPRRQQAGPEREQEEQHWHRHGSGG